MEFKPFSEIPKGIHVPIWKGEVGRTYRIALLNLDRTGLGGRHYFPGKGYFQCFSTKGQVAACCKSGAKLDMYWIFPMLEYHILNNDGKQYDKDKFARGDYGTVKIFRASKFIKDTLKEKDDLTSIKDHDIVIKCTTGGKYGVKNDFNVMPDSWWLRNEKVKLKYLAEVEKLPYDDIDHEIFGQKFTTAEQFQYWFTGNAPAGSPSLPTSEEELPPIPADLDVAPTGAITAVDDFFDSMKLPDEQ